MTDPGKPLSGLLQAWAEGDLEARDRALSVVYDELRRQAARYLRRERAGHTLQPTALVHETYIRLAEPRHTPWQNRAHFFAAAAQAMRRILVDHARRRDSAKRGGERTRVTLDEGLPGGERELALLALDEALDAPSDFDPEHARLVELRFFGGLSIEETASLLGVSPTTVKRDWALARAWLHGLSHPPDPEQGLDLVRPEAVSGLKHVRRIFPSGGTVCRESVSRSSASLA